MAVLVQMTANIHRDTERRLQPFELEEVLGWLGHPALVDERPAEPVQPTPPTPDELREKLRVLAQMYPQPNGQQREGT